MKELIDLPLNQKYLIGASGGSDSMTLLSLCLKRKMEVVVCHVNYKLRAHADVEEQLLRDYCRENDVKMHVIYPKMTEKGNFQKWARDVRYGFYKDIYDKEGCDALLLGHQLDDSIENYLMSLERGSHGFCYGIAERSFHHGMQIIRPLLHWRKKETRNYCLGNNVPFGDDESNFSDKYTRNRIRHQLVEKADDEQIASWQREIEEKNESLRQMQKTVTENFTGESVELEKYRQQPVEIRHLVLRYLTMDRLEENLSGSFVEEIDRVLCRNSRPGQIRLDDNLLLVHQYGMFYLCPEKDDYQYEYDGQKDISNRYFRIDKQGEKIERFVCREDEFPLVIRNWHSEDRIRLRYGVKKVNRFFIDRKIPYRQRISWPVVVNNRNEVVFVCGIGCDVDHYDQTGRTCYLKRNAIYY